MMRVRDFHPTLLLLYFVLVIGFSMITQNPLWIFASFFFASFYYIRIYQFKRYATTLLRMLPLILFIILLNSLLNGLGLTVLFYLGKGNPVTLESLCFGLFSGLLLIAVLLWFSAWQQILTSDVWLTVFGRHFPTVGLALAMIMKYVPDTLRQGAAILLQEKALTGEARGNAKSKFRFAGRILTVLLSWSMENSLQTADSMAARGYPSDRRVNFDHREKTRADRSVLLLLSSLAVIQLFLLLRGNSRFIYYPYLLWQGREQGWGENMLAIGSLLLLYLFPVMADLIDHLQWRRAACGKIQDEAQGKGGIVIDEGLN